MRRRWLLMTLAATVSLALIMILMGGYLLWRQRAGFTRPSASAAGTPAALSRYYHQKLTWKYCGGGAHCTRIVVPIDYAKPDGPTLSLAAKVYPSKGDRYLFVNPGGPGGSAQDFAGTMKDKLPASLRAEYSVIGVDPRGVGQSTPLSCLSAKQFDAFSASDPDPDSPAEVATYQADTTKLGQACEKNSGVLAAHVSTEEAARDFDIVRALMGQSKLDWFGASYGTILGATYANLFPTRVGRMVLDGAIDPTLTVQEQALGQTKGFQKALDSYLAACVKGSSCPQGWTSAAQGSSAIAGLMSSLDAKPLPGAAGRKLTQGLAFYGIALPLYSKSYWPLLTSALKAAFKGDGGPLVKLADAYFSRSSGGGYTDNSGQVIYAVNCLDTDEQVTVAQVEKALPSFEAVSPVFGRAMAWGMLSCSDWPIRATHPQQAVRAAGAPPIVVVGTTRDPATPYAWAKALAGQLKSGVLVTRDGDGHTGYGEGNSCVDDAVNAYLLNGTVPKDGLVCR